MLQKGPVLTRTDFPSTKIGFGLAFRLPFHSNSESDARVLHENNEEPTRNLNSLEMECWYACNAGDLDRIIECRDELSRACEAQKALIDHVMLNLNQRLAEEEGEVLAKRKKENREKKQWDAMLTYF